MVEHVCSGSSTELSIYTIQDWKQNFLVFGRERAALRARLVLMRISVSLKAVAVELNGSKNGCTFELTVRKKNIFFG